MASDKPFAVSDTDVEQWARTHAAAPEFEVTVLVGALTSVLLHKGIVTNQELEDAKVEMREMVVQDILGNPEKRAAAKTQAFLQKLAGR